MELKIDNWDESQIISKIGSWSWEISSNKVLWSKNMYRMLGLEPFECKPTYDLAYHHVYTPDKKEYEEKLNQAIKNKTDYYFENRIVRNGDEIVSVISRGRCIMDDNENLIQMVGTVQDITSLKELEHVRLEKSRVEKKNEMKSFILRIIAHDIYGHVHTINGLSKVLIRQVENRDVTKVLHYSTLINKSSVHVRKILDNLFEWALVELEINDFNPKSVFPHAILKNIIKDNPFVKSKNITLNNTIKPDTSITADKKMLNVIMRNIISNSIKFSNLNGEITISLVRENNELSFSISDKGIGIQPEILKNIINDNKISSTHGTANEKGFGLGLYICKKFIEKHNGRFWIESKIGKGTTCNFSIPQDQK